MTLVEASGQSTVRIVVLFPDLLGTYGDGGNAVVLGQRCRWRGIPVKTVSVSIGDPLPEQGDIYLLGGGEDRAQGAAAHGLRVSRGARAPLARAVTAGAQLLAVCAGLQLAGTSFYDSAGHETAGLGLLDLTTTRLRRRAVGELMAAPQPDLGLTMLSGFENHGGHTLLGPDVRPLAVVQHGVGNGPRPPGRPAGEGAVTPNIIATYLHGPLLARNPALADLLIARATGVPLHELTPLDIPEHDQLRQSLAVWN